ncbi:MAG: DUF4271 domain-containing protein [Bacteroidales bacterium]|nr:DUF4271 domain-containing protein [Bacteroidales bacterium]
MPGQDTIVQAIFTGSAVEISSVVPPGGGIEIMARIPFHQPTWFFIYLFLMIGFFAWIRLYYGNMLIQTLQASTNFQVANRIYHDNSQLQRQLDIILYIYYFLSLAFLLFLIENRVGRHPYELQGALLYLFNLALLASLFLGKLVLFNTAAFLFNKPGIVREYLYNIFIFNKLLGIVILPLMFLLVYTQGAVKEVFFWSSILVLSGVVVMRIIRGIVFSYRKEVLVFYMFLYLCALEIVPLVLLYRWLEGVL